MMIKLHTFEIISTAVKQIKILSAERGFPLHAALYSNWGVGKTVACKQVKEAIQDVFYFKFPARQVEPAGLIKEILLALGIGPTRGYLNNYDLLIKVLSARGITQPILLIDEAQLLFARPSIMSFFKDLSEDPEIGFSYVFIGDERLGNALRAEGHSLIKRIKVKVQIPVITKGTIEKLSQFHGVDVQDTAFEIAKKLGATTMDVDFALFLAKKAGKTTLNSKEFKAFILSAKRG